MNNAPYFIGLDVGGQSIKGGIVDAVGHPLCETKVPTEAYKGQEHGLNQMAICAEQALAKAGIDLNAIAAIGVATPGTMDLQRGLMLEPPNLRPWKNVPVRDYIRNRFQRTTVFQNDANAAAFGEYWAGAGRGTRSMVLFTLGTGIGCGIIVNDCIIEGAHSHGSEVGHIVIQMKDGRMCGCGQPGHLEAYASARAIVKHARQVLRDSDRPCCLRESALVEDVVTAGSPEEEETLDARHARLVFEAAEQGDELAREIEDEVAYALAVGAVNMMHTIDPERIVFGGGMTASGPYLLERIRHYVKKHAFPVPAAETEVIYAELGNRAGFIGAAGYARKVWQGLGCPGPDAPPAPRADS